MKQQRLSVCVDGRSWLSSVFRLCLCFAASSWELHDGQRQQRLRSEAGLRAGHHEHQRRALSPQAGLRPSIMSIRRETSPLTSSRLQGRASAARPHLKPAPGPGIMSISREPSPRAEHHKHQPRALSPQARPSAGHHEHQPRALSLQAGPRPGIMSISRERSHLKPASGPAS